MCVCVCVLWCVYVCVCVGVCERERERERDKEGVYSIICWVLAMILRCMKKQVFLRILIVFSR